MTLEAKNFYKSLINVVGPIAIQNLIAAAVSSADVIMLGYVGQTAIAASSLAGNIQFLLIMVATGTSSGLVMLAAQYWGKQDTESIRTLHGIALRISAVCGLIFSIAAMFFPHLLMKIFTDEVDLFVLDGDKINALPSTIVSVCDGNFKIIRQGCLKIN